MMMTTNDQDSLTYTIISGYGPPLGPGTFDLFSFSFGGSRIELPDGISVNFSKRSDNSSPGFMIMNIYKTLSNNVSIEIKIFKKGESAPYFGYKLTNILILSYSAGLDKYGKLIENYIFLPKILEFKNYITGGSVAWDSSGSTTSY